MKAEDRSVKPATSPSVPQHLTSSYSIPENPKQPASLERVFLFLEYGLTLTIIGIVGGLVGLFIDGRYFLVLCIPTLLGIHRSNALKGLSKMKCVTSYAVVLILSATIFWEVGKITNTSREHSPTAGLAPPQGPPAASQSTNTPPGVSPELPALGFQDDTDTVDVTFGQNNTGGVHIAMLKKMPGHTVFPISYDGYTPVKLEYLNGKVSYSVKFWSPTQNSVIEVKDGKFVVRNPNLDRNYSSRAFEVVTKDGHPILQIVWLTPGHMRLNGLFPLASGNLLCMSNDNPRTVEPAIHRNPPWHQQSTTRVDTAWATLPSSSGIHPLSVARI